MAKEEEANPLYEANKHFEPYNTGSIAVGYRGDGVYEGHLWRFGHILMTIQGNSIDQVQKRFNEVKHALNHDHKEQRKKKKS